MLSFRFKVTKLKHATDHKSGQVQQINIALLSFFVFFSLRDGKATAITSISNQS